MQVTSQQRHVVAAAYLGWTLDAFDFFIMVFVLRDIAQTFATTITVVTIAITLTLAMRALGAWIFGRLADRFGRRPTLMANILTVFGAGTRHRLLTHPHSFHRSQGAVRHCDGWGVGRWRLSHHGSPSRSLARSGLRPAAGRLSQRLPAGHDRLLDRLRLCRLARAVCDRRAAGPAGILYPPLGAGESRLACPAGQASALDLVGAAPASWADDLRRDPDDGVQLLQPWFAGSVSHFPAGAAQAAPEHRRHDRYHLQYRCHHRRHRLRHAVAAHRPESRHRHRRTSRACRSSPSGPSRPHPSPWERARS